MTFKSWHVILLAIVFLILGSQFPGFGNSVVSKAKSVVS